MTDMTHFTRGEARALSNVSEGLHLELLILFTFTTMNTNKIILVSPRAKGYINDSGHDERVAYSLSATASTFNPANP